MYPVKGKVVNIASRLFGPLKTTVSNSPQLSLSTIIWTKNSFSNLIIINVTHISMFRNYSFNFGRNVAKRGRNMEGHWERNIAEPKFQLKSFRPSSCIFYGRGRI